jgi:LysM repeat protein
MPSIQNYTLILSKEDIYYNKDKEVIKMKKRIPAYLIIFTALIFSFYACGDEEQPETTPQITPQEVQTPVTEKKEPVEKIKKKDTAPRKEAKSTVPETYVVEKGETLASIAEKFYGDSQKWFHIFALNESNIDNWNKIYYGQKLKMPQFDETK